jgi:Ca2+-binding RTX toxin-like protein
MPIGPASPFVRTVVAPRVQNYATIGDFNNDGLLEPFGLINNGDGTFDDAPSVALRELRSLYPGRVHRDSRAVDLDLDGNLDVVQNVYSAFSNTDSYMLVFYGDGAGGFSRVVERPDIFGFGETLVTADFNNDGYSDIFSPRYAHVIGSDGNHLLLNNNGVLGDNVAEAWGVDQGNLPSSFRVEGAQAADVDFDGKIDLFSASSLFLNDGSRFVEQPLDEPYFDEGASLFDFDNDGDFDLVLRTDEGAPKLYEWSAGKFVDRGLMAGPDIVSGDGLKTFDIDANGWEDVAFSSDNGLTLLLNYMGVFSRIDLPDVPYAPTLAFGDLNNDRRIDLLVRTEAGESLILEGGGPTDALRLTLLGPNGELNQHGRPVLLTAKSQPDLVLARVVESGSGFLSQSQYSMLFGLPVAGEYSAKVRFSDREVVFAASAGLDISVYADGRVAATGTDRSDFLGGAEAADRLDGGADDDRIYGSLGADLIEGGAGADTLDYSHLELALSANLSLGHALVGSTVQIVAGVEHLAGTRFSDSLTGDSGLNVLIGAEGDDLLDGGEGADTLVGGLGGDVFIVDDATDAVVEGEGEGIDEVRTSLSTYVLAANIEKLTGIGADGQTLIGNDLDNRFDGGLGADRFVGGAGDDDYVVQGEDEVVELAGEGFDSITTDLVSYRLPASVEVLIGTSSVGQRLEGNELANVISGEGGPDEMIGGLGDDAYDVGEGDTVLELEGEGYDQVRTALTAYALPDFVESVLGTAAASQALTGNALANRFASGTGVGTFAGLTGDDTYIVVGAERVVEDADSGWDEVWTSRNSYILPANVEKWLGLSGRGQKVVGNDLDNLFDGSVGSDSVHGLGGDDTFIARNVYDYFYENAGEGYDTVKAAVSYELSGDTDIELLMAIDPTETTGINLVGNNVDNRIIGNAGRNNLYGLDGADTLIGLEGDDVYIVDAGDTVIELDIGGRDAVIATSNFSLTPGSFIELLSTTNHGGRASIDLAGNELTNVVIGNAGSNRLDGGGGSDLLQGLGGDDTYIVDSDDTILEAAAGGFDRVRAKTAYLLSESVEIEVLEAFDLSSTDGLELTGNSLANHVIGNAGANLLDGGGGADVLEGGEGDDIYVVEGGAIVVELVDAGFDLIRTQTSYRLSEDLSIEALEAVDGGAVEAINLTGNGLSNRLVGNAGSNRLDGGGGADVLVGMAGNDVFVVDDPDDVVVEDADGGRDNVWSRISYALGAGVHVEILSTNNHDGAASIDLTGNELANIVIGNAGSNVLHGGGGADLLQGLGGDDTYIVDGDDSIIEVAGGGTDTVRALTGYRLAPQHDIEVLAAFDSAATARLDLTGNGLAGRLVGNAGVNFLDGGGGADVLIGLGGDDVMVVDDPTDIVIEDAGGGHDNVWARASYSLMAGAHVEILSTTNHAGTEPINLAGNELANIVIGNAGSNTLSGGGGESDVLQGLGGADAFVLVAGQERVRILDMVAGEDRIELTGYSGDLLPPGALAPEAFHTGAAAMNEAQRILYDPRSGAVLFDPDGIGALEAVQIATLASRLPIAAADFFVI